MKKCPYCAEEIQDEAVKCRYCGSLLTTAPHQRDTAAVRFPSADDRASEGTPTTVSQTVLAQRYRIVREVGHGGMGAVYLARDGVLDLDVAVKFLPPFLARDPREMERLKGEARTAMSLAHPNIVRVHTLEETPEATFLVMEYVEGCTLEDLIGQRGRLGLEELLPMAEQVAAGLDYAHEVGVLHRDIKPSNILVLPDGTAKIADFGIARRIKESVTHLTGHEIAGTLLYMSPEQLMGEKLDARSDIYSFGAVLYECLSGRPPFTEGHIATQIREKRPADLEDAPEYANDAIQWALAKEPGQRPGNAFSLVARLRGWSEPGLEPGFHAPVVLRAEPRIAFGPRLAEWTEGLLAPEQVEAAEKAGVDPLIHIDVGGGVTMKMVFIPAGEFLMGSLASEQDRDDDEGPQHPVRLTTGFYLAMTMVTQAQWQAVMEEAPGERTRWTRADPRHPANHVSWEDCQEFLTRLNAKVPGGGFALPTEAQWEYACRAGSTTRFCYGDDPDYSQLADHAWHKANAGDVGENYPHPVGLKRPNTWGLYDMHGNVCEWCSDWYGPYAEGLEIDPQGPPAGDCRVLRSGSWLNMARYQRSAYRYGILTLSPLYRGDAVGFRCARNVASPSS